MPTKPAIPTALTLALVLVLALAGCGSSGDETVTVGSSEVTFSSDERRDTISGALGVAIGRVPYAPEYARCLEGEVEKTVDEDDESELEGLSKEETEQRVLELVAAAAVPCEGVSPQFDSTAKPSELGLLRSGEAEALGRRLRYEGVAEPIASCMEREVGAMSIDRLLTLLEAPPRMRRAMIQPIAEACEARLSV